MKRTPEQVVRNVQYRSAFSSPALLGNSLFHGQGGAGDVAVTMPVVLGYTAVHLAGFELFGPPPAAARVSNLGRVARRGGEGRGPSPVPATVVATR